MTQWTENNQADQMPVKAPEKPKKKPTKKVGKKYSAVIRPGWSGTVS